MKKITLIFLLIALTYNMAFSQADYQEINRLYKSKELLQAAELIPEAVKNDFKNLELFVLSGDIYFELERYQDAYNLFKKADDIDGGEPYILQRLGLTNSMLGKHLEAIQNLKEAVKESKKGKDLNNVKLILAKVYIAADSLNQAELIVTQVRDEDKKNPEVYVTLGDLYFAQRVYALAQDNYEEALEIDPNLIDARRKLAISYYWLANREYDEDLANELFTRSLKEWNEITKQDPKDAKAWYEQGRILFFASKFPEAAKSLYEYVQLRPQGDLGRWYLAQSLYEVGACDSAAPHLEVVAERMDSVSIKSQLLLARCYLENKNYPKSAEVYFKIKEKTQLEMADRRRLGQAQLFSMDTLGAIETWSAAIKDDPEDENNCKLAYSLGQLLTSRKMSTEAIKMFKYWLINNSCEPDLAQISRVNYFVGYNYVFMEKSDSTISYNDSASYYLYKAIEIDSTNHFARLYLGDTYAAQEMHEKAIIEFQYIIDNADTTSNKPVIIQSFAKIAGLYLDDKNWSNLLTLTKQWIEMLGDEEYAWLYRAVGYQGSSNVDEACKAYKKVLTINTKNSTAKKNYDALGCGKPKE